MQKKTSIRWLVPILTLALTGAVWAKLPPPSEEQKAKAVETKAKADEAAKKESELVAAAQDRVVNRYIAAQKALGNEVKPTPIVAAVPPSPAPASASTPAPASPPIPPTAPAPAVKDSAPGSVNK